MPTVQFARDDALRVINLAATHGKELCFVKDDGVYLMTSGMKGIDPTANDAGNVCVYAEGLNPKTDEDVWEKARSVCGGDDFGETFDTAMVNDLHGLLERATAAKYFALKLTSDQIEFTTQQRRVSI